MNNNDILIRVRYALDIKNTDMVEIFKLGGVEVTKEEVMKMLIKSKDGYHDEANNHEEVNHELTDTEEGIKCNDFMVEEFLNGLIIFRRGQQDQKPEQPERKSPSLKNSESINNILLKKLKIALSLTSEDMLTILESAGLVLSKGELSAVFRKEGHKNYKECGDKYARNFLKGLAIKYRG